MVRCYSNFITRQRRRVGDLGENVAQERAELERLLRERPVETPKTIAPPDQAARRKRIFGDKVLPNFVLLAREGAI